MPQKRFPMTEKGLKTLKQELEQLETIKRPRAKQRIKHARSFCDFQEESEYESALKELAGIDERIPDLKYMIQQADKIHPANSSRVKIGSTVTFHELDADTAETYMIVGTEEADPLQGKVSYDSPVAKSLLGAKVNDKVTIEAPSGNLQVKITGIT